MRSLTPHPLFPRCHCARPVLCSILLSAGLWVMCSCEKKEDPVPPPGSEAHPDSSLLPLSRRCAECHPAQFRAWAGSDHARAFRSQVAALDDAPFSVGTQRLHGNTYAFRILPDGRREMQEGEHRYVTRYAVGCDPLVQYLVPGRRGALHTPSVAWDTDRHEWFDIFADDARQQADGTARRSPGDWGHWLGRGMNFNSQCAQCHTSGYTKNYSEQTDSYSSTWQEPGVTCIRCHPVSRAPDAGDGCPVEPAKRKLTAKQISDNCASCHARAEELDDTFRPGDRFEDHYRLELPVVQGVYMPNGMQRDEVYCETGFRLSRMAAAGVTCTDCHRRENGNLILPYEDNSLCLRCHGTGLTEIHGTRAPISGGAPDGTCVKESVGGRCVECHMPESPYMARDMRRDHSLNIPDPVLSLELGIPNACTMCHKDKDDAWAADVLQRAIPKQKTEERRPRTRAVFAAMQGCGKTADLLAALQREDIPAWRATLLELLARQPQDQETEAAARAAAADTDALVRSAAACIPGEHLGALLRDDTRAVRHTAAWTLLQTAPEKLRGSPALQEIRRAALHRADQPSGAMQLAAIALVEGDLAQAEQEYRRAILLDPSSPVPYMDYAVLLARLDRLSEALDQMLACVRVAPHNAEAQYRLGLILADLAQYHAAVTALQRALREDPHHERARQALESVRSRLR